MKRLRKQHVLEQSIYGAIWIVIFLLPLIGGYFAMSGGLEREETRMVIRESWLSILPFFVLFLLNNYGLVPYFLFKKLAIYCFVDFCNRNDLLAFSVSFCQSFPQRFQARRVASSYEGEPEGPDY